jgi:hypothetical protein
MTIPKPLVLIFHGSEVLGSIQTETCSIICRILLTCMILMCEDNWVGFLNVKGTICDCQKSCIRCGYQKFLVFHNFVLIFTTRKYSDKQDIQQKYVPVFKYS